MNGTQNWKVTVRGTAAVAAGGGAAVVWDLAALPAVLAALRGAPYTAAPGTAAQRQTKEG